MWGIGYNGVKFFLGLVYSNFSYLRHIFITEIEEVSCENIRPRKHALTCQIIVQQILLIFGKKTPTQPY